MKKKISTILLIGIISMISMGFQSSSSVNVTSQHSSLKIVKGDLVKSDKHHDWKMVTFGLKGYNTKRYQLAYVNIINKFGDLMARVEDFSTLDSKGNSVDWFGINLDDLDVPRDFFLEVHVSSKKGSVVNSFYGAMFSLAASVDGSTSPNDPDETVLILKYP